MSEPRKVVGRNLRKVDGVDDVAVNFASEKATVTFDPYSIGSYAEGPVFWEVCVAAAEVSGAVERGAVPRFVVYGTDGNFFRNYLFLLNTGGQLWRIGLPSLRFPRATAPLKRFMAVQTRPGSIVDAPFLYET